MAEQNFTSTQPTKSQQELISQCFYYINSFKRHRALQQVRRHEGDINKAQYHELKMYHMFDALELGLRALQSGERTREEGDEE